MSQKQIKQTKSKTERDLSTPPPLWSQNRIPPLVSINSSKEKEPQDRISIQSLNQSEVRSIYTIDREETDKHTLEIFDRAFRNQKEEHVERYTGRPEAIQEGRSTLAFETPNTKKDYQTAYSERISRPKQPEKYDDYSAYPALKLYQQLVVEPLKERQSPTTKHQKYQFPWMKTKSPTELIASLITNQRRMSLYIHYLLKEIHRNEQAKMLNELYQQNVHEYNPTLKEVYNGIICLFCKIIARESSKKKRGSPEKEPFAEVSLFENGLSIDIDPKMSSIKRENNEKIRQLRQTIAQKQQNIVETKKIYEQIIHNYAITIENLNRQEDPQPLIAHPPLKESRVHLEIEQQQDFVRKKNHTFGMNQFTLSKP